MNYETLKKEIIKTAKAMGIDPMALLEKIITDFEKSDVEFQISYIDMSKVKALDIENKTIHPKFDVLFKTNMVISRILFGNNHIFYRTFN